MYSLIVGINKNYFIGNKETNDLLYHFSNDIKMFKKLTTETNNDKKNVVIMGKNTYLSIPNNRKPLKNRINIVLSSTMEDKEGIIVLKSIKEILFYIENNKKLINHCYIIGGGLVYEEFLKLKIIDYAYITIIEDTLENNEKYIKFPVENINNNFKLISKTTFDDVNIYDKKNYILSFNKFKFINKEEINYLNDMQKILTNGIIRNDRTGTGTISIFSNYVKYDIRNNKIPLLTTKRVFFKGILHELLWFISGSSNVKSLKDNNVHIWDKNSTREFLDKRGLTNLEENDIGTGYGFNLRHFGGQYKGMNENYENEGFDQLKYVIDLLKNNPNSRRILFNYWNPSALETVALPPCFKGDALVSTLSGYKQIKNVKENDMVLTFDGSYQKVLKVFRTIYNNKGYKMIFNGIKNFTTTKNHPFLIRNFSKNIISSNEKCLENDEEFNYDISEPIWKKAVDIHSSCYFGIPINEKEEVNEIFMDNKYNNIFIILGYFFRYGSINNNNLNIIFYNENTDKYFEILSMFNKLFIIYDKKTINNNLNYIINEYKVSNKLFNIFYENNIKIIPEFIINLPKNKVKNFLYGFNYWSDELNYENSIENMLSIQRLYLKINMLSYINENDNNVKLERKYSTNKINENDKIFIRDGYGWFLLERKVYVNFTQDIVYNLQVNKNNTYTVNNISTHNCHLLYQFYVDIEKNELHCQFYQRSQDYFLANNFNIVSASILTRMLAHITGYKAGDIYQTTGDTHIYKNHIEQCKEQMKRESKTFPLLFIEDNENNIKKIEDFKFENFKLINYNPEKSIKAEMSA